MADLFFWFVVLGSARASYSMFCVEVAGTISVSELKELVYAETRNTFRGLNATRLVLWRVSWFIHSTLEFSDTFPHYQLNNAIHTNNINEELDKFGQDLSPVAVEMLPTMHLSDYFPSPPLEESLHIIVEGPHY